MNLKSIVCVTALAIFYCTHINAQDKSKVAYQQVAARNNATSNNWKTYTAKTIDRLPGFKIKPDPSIMSLENYTILICQLKRQQY